MNQALQDVIEHRRTTNDLTSSDELCLQRRLAPFSGCRFMAELRRLDG